MVSNWAGRSLGCSPKLITHAGARSRRGWSSSPPTSAGASRGRGNNPSELQYPLRRRPPWRIAVSHSLVLRKSELTLQALDAPAERRGVVARRPAAARIGAPVAVGEVGKMSVQHRQEPLAHRRI